MSANKRRFARIPFDALITLAIKGAGETSVTGTLQDISLKGAMVTLHQDAHTAALTTGQSAELTIRPEQGDLVLMMTVEIAYCLPESNLYGLNITSLDIESAGHLRRLIEVNLGDDASLQRELSKLIEAMESEHQTD